MTHCVYFLVLIIARFFDMCTPVVRQVLYITCCQPSRATMAESPGI